MKITPTMTKLLKAKNKAFWEKFLINNSHLPRIIDDDEYVIVSLGNTTHWGSK